MRYDIPQDVWPLVANLHRDQKASLASASDAEWDLLRRQEEERKKARRPQGRRAVKAASVSSPAPTVPMHSVPWHVLPKRVQRLLAGLTMLAEEPERQLSSASYRELMPFVGGSRPQVPQTLKLAKELGVVTVWTEATRSNQGRTGYFFCYYTQALALGLSLKCQVEMSVVEIDAALAAGFSPGEARDHILETLHGSTKSVAPGGSTGETEPGPPLQARSEAYPPVDTSDEQAYPTVEDADSVGDGTYPGVQVCEHIILRAYPCRGYLGLKASNHVSSDLFPWSQAPFSSTALGTG